MQKAGTIAVRNERSALDIAYRAAVALWLGVSAVQLVVYLAVAAGTGSLDSPWFLWWTVVGGLVVAGLRYARTHPAATWFR